MLMGAGEGLVAVPVQLEQVVLHKGRTVVPRYLQELFQDPLWAANSADAQVPESDLCVRGFPIHRCQGLTVLEK